jgi:TetR/AcrR family transcriptional regulator, cholesterol catabolism regulator
MPRPKTFKRKPEIYRTVARLFARNGYERTSIRDITSELGMSKSSLYYYFKSKEELLFNLANDCMDDALEVLEEIIASDIPPDEKIGRLFRFYASFFVSDNDRLTLLVTELQSLGAPLRKILLEKERRYVSLLRSVLTDLDSQGVLKEIHPTVAVFAFFGMVHYTYKWYDPNGPISPRELADGFCEIFTQGVLKSGLDENQPEERYEKAAERK